MELEKTVITELLERMQLTEKILTGELGIKFSVVFIKDLHGNGIYLNEYLTEREVNINNTYYNKNEAYRFESSFEAQEAIDCWKVNYPKAIMEVEEIEFYVALRAK